MTLGKGKKIKKKFGVCVRASAEGAWVQPGGEGSGRGGWGRGAGGAEAPRVLSGAEPQPRPAGTEPLPGPDPDPGAGPGSSAERGDFGGVWRIPPRTWQAVI